MEIHPSLLITGQKLQVAILVQDLIRPETAACKGVAVAHAPSVARPSAENRIFMFMDERLVRKLVICYINTCKLNARQPLFILHL